LAHAVEKYMPLAARSEAAMGGGRAAPRWSWQRAQKDGCAQRTGAHARPKPTSLEYFIRIQSFKIDPVSLFLGGHFVGKSSFLLAGTLFLNDKNLPNAVCKPSYKHKILVHAFLGDQFVRK
jgi:hypothetical protein